MREPFYLAPERARLRLIPSPPPEPEQIPGRTEQMRRPWTRALPEVDPADYPPDSVALEHSPMSDPIVRRGLPGAVLELARDAVVAVRGLRSSVKWPVSW